MSPGARRRRAALLLSLAVACGGLAASEVTDRVREADARVGSPVPVLMAARDIEPGRELRSRDLALRDVPSRFVPPDALTSPEEAEGASPTAPLSRGSYVTAAVLGAGAQEARAGVLRRGERAVEVRVSGSFKAGDAAAPGARVDVLVSTEPREGPGRSFLALEDVGLLDLRDASSEAAAASGDEGAASRATAVATLRVTLRQAVYLTAAQNFAREVRLLPRPVGDRRRSGRAAVAANGL